MWVQKLLKADRPATIAYFSKLEHAIHLVRNSRGKKSNLTSQKDISVACDSSLRLDAVAKLHKTSEPSVQTARVAVATVISIITITSLTEWLREVEAEQPLATFMGRAFDSAKSVLKCQASAPMIESLSEQQSIQPLHMNIIHRFICIIWESRVVELRFSTPPVPSYSTDASCIGTTVDIAPKVKAEHDICLQMIRASRTGGILDCTDGAFSNLKYENWVMQRNLDDVRRLRMPVGGHREHLDCGNHNNRLGERRVQAYVDVKRDGSSVVMSKLCRFLSFMRSSASLLRMLSVLYICVLQYTSFECGKVLPPGANCVARQLFDEMEYHHVRTAKTKRSSKQSPQHSKQC